MANCFEPKFRSLSLKTCHCRRGGVSSHLKVRMNGIPGVCFLAAMSGQQKNLCLLVGLAFDVVGSREMSKDREPKAGLRSGRYVSWARGVRS